MLPLLFLLALAAATEPPPTDQDVASNSDNCPPFWYSFNGRCYKYVSTRLSWADAELNCVSQGANLVSIHSLEEDAFVRNLIKNFDEEQGNTWIGFQDSSKEGSWMWSDGSAVTFTYWADGQPDNTDNNENCGEMRVGTSVWNDWGCENTVPSVCKARLTCI